MAMNPDFTVGHVSWSPDYSSPIYIDPKYLFKRAKLLKPKAVVVRPNKKKKRAK